MIRPPGFRGTAFLMADDGDPRHDIAARDSMAKRLGLPDTWAFPTQVHGASVVEATGGGRLGDADAVFTRTSAVAVAVATADCVPVVLEGTQGAAVIHAGWRGAITGVVPATLERLSQSGVTVDRAAIGPSIGPCCYEVGADVAAQFGDHVATTRRGSVSVDIAGLLTSQLVGIDVWRSDVCTFDHADYHSYRATGTRERQVAVAWLPAA